jgi:hypothetical protein
MPRRPATEPAAPAAVTPTAPSAGRQPEQPPLTAHCRRVRLLSTASGAGSARRRRAGDRHAGGQPQAGRLTGPAVSAAAAAAASGRAPPESASGPLPVAGLRQGPGPRPGPAREAGRAAQSWLLATKPGRRLPVSPSAHGRLGVRPCRTGTQAGNRPPRSAAR